MQCDIMYGCKFCNQLIRRIYVRMHIMCWFFQWKKLSAMYVRFLLSLLFAALVVLLFLLFTRISTLFWESRKFTIVFSFTTAILKHFLQISHAFIQSDALIAFTVFIFSAHPTTSLRSLYPLSIFLCFRSQNACGKITGRILLQFPFTTL